MERSRRRSVALATLLCGCVLVIAATAVEQSLSTNAHRPPESLDRSPPGGLLLVLLAFLFGLFGLDPPETLGAPGGPGLGSLLAVLASNAAELAAVAALVVLSAGVLAALRRVDFAERLDGDASAPAGPTARERPESLRTVEPANDVYRAWLDLVRRVASDPSRSRTPSEWAERAVDAGLDPDAVSTVTDTFRAVRYGGAAVTEDEKRRVRDALARLDAKRGPDE